jgi:hypothetical protein
MADQHSPDWTVEKHGDFWLVSHPAKPANFLVRKTKSSAIKARNEANAHARKLRLEAAAPAMLAALQFVRNANGDNKHFPCDCMTKINEAIAKATGA